MTSLLISSYFPIVSDLQTLSGWSQSFQIYNSRLGIKFSQNLVPPLVLKKARHLRLRVHQIAKDVGPCWARLYTCRLNLAVPELPPLNGCQVTGILNPLHAECTLLHHTATPGC